MQHSYTSTKIFYIPHLKGINILLALIKCFGQWYVRVDLSETEVAAKLYAVFGETKNDFRRTKTGNGPSKHITQFFRVVSRLLQYLQ